MEPTEGAVIKAYGQTVTIDEVEYVGGKVRIYLEHPIVVPGREYTRDWLDED